MHQVVMLFKFVLDGINGERKVLVLKSGAGINCLSVFASENNQARLARISTR
jgi:hypothetical protein